MEKDTKTMEGRARILENDLREALRKAVEFSGSYFPTASRRRIDSTIARNSVVLWLGELVKPFSAGG